MKRLPLLALLLAALAFTAPRAEAQFTFTPYIGYDFDGSILDDGGAILVGVGTSLGFLPGVLPVALSLRPSAEYYFLNDVSNVSQEKFKVNIDAVAQLNPPAANLGLYAGGGLGIAFTNTDIQDSSTDLGLNILGGLEFGRAFTRPYVQGRLTLGDNTALALMGGVRLSL